MPRLIFFTGHAGTGKTTLSKRAVPRLHARTGENFAFLDKDTVYGGYSARMMQLLTGDPDDRDSPTFLQNLREPEYEGLLAVTRENLEIGVALLSSDTSPAGDAAASVVDAGAEPSGQPRPRIGPRPA